MANKPCLARLRKELRSFDPPPFVRAAPLEANMQEWHYVLQGPPDTPYVGGLYHGKLKFPDDFPFKPPSIYMLTPNGRFETDRRLCLSISDFHPETWVPTWSVATILNGVLSFMLETAPTTGSVESDDATKTNLRDAAQAFNDNDPIFCRLFPELVSGQLFTDPSPPATEPEEATGATEEDKGPPVEGPPAPPTVGSQMARCAIGAPAAGPPVSPAPKGGLAPVAGARDWLAAAEAGSGGSSGGGGNETGGPASPGAEEGSGKNAARNRKKRDKELEKRRGGGEEKTPLGGDGAAIPLGGGGAAEAAGGDDETGVGEAP